MRYYQTLWFMQTYLTDLSTTRRNTPSFTICQRVLLKAQNIIFSDPPMRYNTPYQSSSSNTVLSRFWKRKVKPRVGPAIIGMSSVLAGAHGLPQVALTTGRVAIEQGRIPLEEKGKSRPFQGEEEDVTNGLSPSSSILLQRPDAVDQDSDGMDVGLEDSDEEEDVQTFGQSTMSRLNIPASSNTTPSSPVERLSPSTETTRQPGLARRTTIGPSRTSPSLVRPRFSSRVFNPRSTSPSASTPSLHHSSTLPSNPSYHDTFQRVDPSIAAQLLRGHYCRSEVQFLLTLESISNRLLVVPKLAVRSPL